MVVGAASEASAASWASSANRGRTEPATFGAPLDLIAITNATILELDTPHGLARARCLGVDKARVAPSLATALAAE